MVSPYEMAMLGADVAFPLFSIGSAPRPSPFKGEDRRGMGVLLLLLSPIPTPTLPLKGRESLAM